MESTLTTLVSNWALVAVETQSQSLFVHHDPLESSLFTPLRSAITLFYSILFHFISSGGIAIEIITPIFTVLFFLLLDAVAL